MIIYILEATYPILIFIFQLTNKKKFESFLITQQLVCVLFQMASQYYFPEELMVLIMSKLPVKSLVRFKIISKDFTARTTTKCFIMQHLAHSTLVANNKPTFLVIHFRDTFCMTLISDHHLLDHDDDDDDQQQPPIIVELNPEFPFAEDLLDAIIAHGPSNGIFCLEVSVVGHPDRLILWNPATTKIKVLPLPLAPEYSSNWDYFNVVHGFGSIMRPMTTRLCTS